MFPRRSSMSLKGKCCYSIVTYLLDVAPSNLLPRPLPPPPLYFISSKTWLLSNIQQTYIHEHTPHLTHSDVRSADNAWYHIEENF